MGEASLIEPRLGLGAEGMLLLGDAQRVTGEGDAPLEEAVLDQGQLELAVGLVSSDGDLAQVVCVLALRPFELEAALFGASLVVPVTPRALPRPRWRSTC